MDIFEDINRRQEKFLEKPRESMENFIKEEKSFAQGLVNLGLAQSRIDLLIIFQQLHKQYSDLLRKMLEDKLISSASFKDDIRDGGTLQTIRDMEGVVKKYGSKSVPLEESVPALKKAYASMLELVWAKLKRIIFLSGLNPKEKYLNLFEIKTNLEKLEKKYALDLSLIKGLLEGELRNCIQHEKTHFREPNFLVFVKEVNGKMEEFFRVDSEELVEEILKSFTILSAFHHVETLILVSRIEALLKLDDSLLNEYLKTGVLTKEMEETILKNSNNPNST